MSRVIAVVVFGSNSVPLDHTGRVYISTPAHAASGGPANADTWLPIVKDGYVSAVVPDGYPDWLHVDAPGYVYYAQGFADQPGAIAIPAGNHDLVIGPAGTARPDQTQCPALTPSTPAPPGPPTLPPTDPSMRVVVAGLDFTVGGQRWIYRGATDFLLYKKFLDGIDIAPVLAQRAQAGANVVRVLGMVSWGPLYPQNYPHYFTQIQPFFGLLASHGLYAEWVGFADAQIICPSLAEQQAHCAQLYPQLQACPNSLYECCNEPWKNGVDPRNHQQPAGITSASGSYQIGSEDPRQYAIWDYYTFHGRRDGSWRTVIDCCPVEFRRETLGLPCINDEPAKCGSNYTDPRIAEEMGHACSGQNGATFHAVAGLSSDLWSDIELVCARAFFGALR